MNISSNKLNLLFKEELEFVYEKLVCIESESKAYDKYSFLNGKSGYLIFLAYYNKNIEDSYLYNKITKLIEEIIENIQNENLEFNFCKGISGMVWALKHVNKLYSYKFFDKTAFEEIDGTIKLFINNALNHGDYDFLHGALGGILSIHEEYKIEEKNDILDKLLNLSIYESDGRYFWLDYLDNEKSSVNLGLAHGMPNIWYFLSLLKVKENHFLILKIIKDSWNEVKKYQINSASNYPIKFYLLNDKETHSSKLSWCYGDLSIAHTLVLIGKRMNDASLFNEGIELGIKTLHRNNGNLAGLNDLCLCHGYSSCILLYKSLFQLTGNKLFKQSYIRWFINAVDFRKKNGDCKINCAI